MILSGNFTGFKNLEHRPRQHMASRSCSRTFFVVVFSFWSPSIYWEIQRKRTRKFYRICDLVPFRQNRLFGQAVFIKRKSAYPFTNNRANNWHNNLQLSSDWFNYTLAFYRKTERLQYFWGSTQQKKFPEFSIPAIIWFSTFQVLTDSLRQPLF